MRHALLIALLLLPAVARGDFVYTYTGTRFDIIPFGVSMFGRITYGDYTCAGDCRMSGWFRTADSIEDNPAEGWPSGEAAWDPGPVTVLDYSWTDGHVTLTPANSTSATRASAYVSPSDPLHVLESWVMWVSRSDGMYSFRAARHLMNGPYTDELVWTGGTSGVIFSYTDVGATPPTWTVTEVPLPTPEESSILLIVVMLAATLYVHLRRPVSIPPEVRTE